MGLSSFIITKFGAPALLAVIQEKAPELALLIDRLDEMSLVEAFAEAKRAQRISRLSLPLKPVRIDTKRVDWDQYLIRFLTEKPALKVILDLLAEFEIMEIAGVAVAEFLECLTGAGDGKP